MSDPRVSACERVSCWFKIRGWSLREGARRTGLHQQKLWRITTGKQEPRGSELEIIVAALGVSMSEFYGDPPVSPPAAANG